MTKGELIESVLITINGGDLSDDNDFRREDIEAMLNAAIAESIESYQRGRRQERIQDIRLMGGEGPEESPFLVTMEYTPVKHPARTDLHYIDLPFRVQSFVGGGLDDVFPAVGFASYVKVSSRRQISGIPSVGMQATFFWTETADDRKTEVLLYNLGEPVCSHYVRVAVDPAQQDYDDELLLPAGVEMDVIRKLTAHFLQVMQLPGEEENDDVQDFEY